MACFLLSNASRKLVHHIQEAVIMKNTIRKTLLACAVTAALGFSASASAATLFPDFTVDPLGPAAIFVADKITGNYTEIANFNPNGTFTANLYWKAGAFVSNNGTNQ